LAHTGTQQTEAGLLPADWSAVALSDLLTSKQLGGNYKNGVAETAFPLIKMGNLGRGRIDLGKVDYVHPSTRPSIRDRLEAGDVLFNTRNTLDLVGKVALWRGELPEAYFNSNIMRMSFDPTRVGSNAFMNYILNTSRSVSALRAIATGTTSVAAIYSRDFTNVFLPLPCSKTEQRAIAEALTDADALIDSLEQLLTKKRQIKQGAMQELLTGKRRLPGFARKWKDSPLGELLSIRHGKSQKDVECEGGRYPILATGGQIGWADAFLYDQPTVLIGRKGTIDQPRFMDTPFWSVDTLYYSEVKEPHSAKFLYYRFCLIDWMRHNEASGVPSLSGKVIESIVISHPEEDEQEAIARVLTDMDTEITALESRLTKARALKQAMAQTLLTGRIRLVEPTA
jgi:type I restriction enzyme S subunit